MRSSRMIERQAPSATFRGSLRACRGQWSVSRAACAQFAGECADTRDVFSVEFSPVKIVSPDVVKLASRQPACIRLTPGGIRLGVQLIILAAPEMRVWTGIFRCTWPAR